MEYARLLRWLFIQSYNIHSLHLHYIHIIIELMIGNCKTPCRLFVFHFLNATLASEAAQVFFSQILFFASNVYSFSSPSLFESPNTHPTSTASLHTVSIYTLTQTPTHSDSRKARWFRACHLHIHQVLCTNSPQHPNSRGWDDNC